MQAFAPDGTYLNGLTCDSASETSVDLGVITQTGAYTLFVNPQGTDIGSVMTRVANVPVVSGGNLSSGVATSATTTQPGQESTFTFQGTALFMVELRGFCPAGKALASPGSPDWNSHQARRRYDLVTLSASTVNKGLNPSRSVPF